MAIKPITIEFNPTSFVEREMTEYFTGDTGVYSVVVNALKVFQTASQFTYAIVELKIDDVVVGANSLPLTQLNKGKEEELWGYPILRSLLGVAGKRKLTSIVQKDGKKEFLLFKAAKGMKAKVMLQREFSLYENDKGTTKATRKYNLNRFFTLDDYTATELLKNKEAEKNNEPIIEPKSIISTKKLVKDKYKECNKEEWEAIYNNKTSTTTNSDSTELPTDDTLPDEDVTKLPTDNAIEPIVPEITTTDVTKQEDSNLLDDLDNLGL